MSKLYKQDRSTIKGRRAKLLIKSNFFPEDFNPDVEPIGYVCPICTEEVLLVKSNLKPVVRGAFCKCMQWVGHASRVPWTQREWVNIFNTAYNNADYE